MREWPIGAAGCLVLLLFGLSCGSVHRDGPGGAKPQDGGARVLIAARPSEFKQEIVDRLVATYQDRARLTLMDIEDIDDVPEADFDAMVVMGARKGFLMFSVKERRFLRDLEAKDKLILVMTAAVSDWEWDREDIDVITSASTSENVEPTYKEISARLDALIEAAEHR